MINVNKKGSFFHWTVFAIMAAMAFFVWSVQSQLELESPGAWNVAFVDFSHKIELEFLYLDKVATFSANNFLLDSSKKFGFFQTSSCDSFQGYYLLNSGSNYCRPDIIEAEEIDLDLLKYKDIEIASTTKDNLIEQDYIFKLVDSKIVGYSDEEAIFTEKKNKHFFGYKIKPSFSIEFGFDISQEYVDIWNQADSLLGECRGDSNLQTCINSKKPSNWHFSSCPGGSFSSSNQKVPFCVDSPSGKKLFDPDLGQKVDLNYHLALHFG